MLKGEDFERGSLGTGKNESSDENKSSMTERSRGLGRWIFDKKARKRRYISLTGKSLVGSAAVEQSRRDKISDLHPANSARAELRYLMTSVAPRCLDDFFDLGNNSDSAGFEPIIPPNPLDISQWGVPLRVVDRYAAMGVTKLFPWQVDCLGIDDGKVLGGGEKKLCFVLTGHQKQH
jgi:hypothetical protein